VVRSYQDLHVWERSIGWVEQIYRASSAWPADERFGLTSQVRRASVSVPANIAEGAGRRTTGEFLQFIGIARGSLGEVETLLIISERLGYTPSHAIKPLLQEASEIGRMLSGLANSLRS